MEKEHHRSIKSDKRWQKKPFFEEENRNTLLSVITASWEKAVYCVEDDYVGHQVIFIPKAILRNPSDMWDEMSIDEIKGQDIWEQEFIDIDDTLPYKEVLISFRLTIIQI